MISLNDLQDKSILNTRIESNLNSSKAEGFKNKYCLGLLVKYNLAVRLYKRKKKAADLIGYPLEYVLKNLDLFDKKDFQKFLKNKEAIDLHKPLFKRIRDKKKHNNGKKQPIQIKIKKKHKSSSNKKKQKKKFTRPWVSIISVPM